MKPNALMPVGMGSLVAGTILAFTWNWWWILIGFGVAVVCAAIEVALDNSRLEFIRTNVLKRYRILSPVSNGLYKELSPVDFRLVHVTRQRHPQDDSVWTVTMIFEGKERG